MSKPFGIVDADVRAALEYAEELVEAEEAHPGTYHLIQFAIHHRRCICRHAERYSSACASILVSAIGVNLPCRPVLDTGPADPDSVRLVTADHRNVLFIIADDWSPLTRCYGNNVISTPHVDALAARGVVFDYAFCTSPSCAVSRACILTGHHSHTHGQYGHCHGIHGFPHPLVRTLHTAHPAQPRLRHRVHRQEARRAAVGVPVRVRVGGGRAQPGRNGRQGHPVPRRQPRAPVLPARRLHLSAPRRRQLRQRAQPRGHHSRPLRAGRGGRGRRSCPTCRKCAPTSPSTTRACPRYDQVVGAVVAALGGVGGAPARRWSSSPPTTPCRFRAPRRPGTTAATAAPLIVCHPEQRKRGMRSRALMNWTDFCPTILEWCGAPPAAGTRAAARPLAAADPGGRRPASRRRRLGGDLLLAQLPRGDQLLPLPGAARPPLQVRAQPRPPPGDAACRATCSGRRPGPRCAHQDITMLGTPAARRLSSTRTGRPCSTWRPTPPSRTT